MTILFIMVTRALRPAKIDNLFPTNTVLFLVYNITRWISDSTRLLMHVKGITISLCCTLHLYQTKHQSIYVCLYLQVAKIDKLDVSTHGWTAVLSRSFCRLHRFGPVWDKPSNTKYPLWCTGCHISLQSYIYNPSI